MHKQVSDDTRDCSHMRQTCIDNFEPLSYRTIGTHRHTHIHSKGTMLRQEMTGRQLG